MSPFEPTPASIKATSTATRILGANSVPIDPSHAGERRDPSQAGLFREPKQGRAPEAEEAPHHVQLMHGFPLACPPGSPAPFRGNAWLHDILPASTPLLHDDRA
jgi:hypothetical protein